MDQDESRFNGVYSRDLKIEKIWEYCLTMKNGTYVINLDEYADLGTHWIDLYVKNIEIIYFDTSGVEHVPKEIKKTYWI